MSVKVTNSQVADFYNKFSTDQKKTGINLRIRTVFKLLKKTGLNKNSKVLEIGCGVGNLTSLIAKVVTSGKIVSTDISPESVKDAEKLNKSSHNIEFIVSDMSDFTSKHIFDIVIMADVLEHIPIENHLELFKNIRKHISSDGIVAINIPSPLHIEWIRKFNPEHLQIIDQSLYTDKLLQSIYPNDLYLETLISYSLYHKDADHQWIILKPNKNVDLFAKKSNLELGMLNLKSKIF